MSESDRARCEELIAAASSCGFVKPRDKHDQVLCKELVRDGRLVPNGSLGYKVPKG